MDKLKEHLKELRAQREVINKDIRETGQALAELACPFNVGDMVHNGKGEKEIVASILSRSCSPFYTLSVFKFKKAGGWWIQASVAHSPEKYSLA